MSSTNHPSPSIVEGIEAFIQALRICCIECGFTGIWDNFDEFSLSSILQRLYHSKGHTGSRQSEQQMYIPPSSLIYLPEIVHFLPKLHQGEELMPREELIRLLETISRFLNAGFHFSSRNAKKQEDFEYFVNIACRASGFGNTSGAASPSQVHESYKTTSAQLDHHAQEAVALDDVSPYVPPIYVTAIPSNEVRKSVSPSRQNTTAADLNGSVSTPRGGTGGQQYWPLSPPPHAGSRDGAHPAATKVGGAQPLHHHGSRQVSPGRRDGNGRWVHPPPPHHTHPGRVHGDSHHLHHHSTAAAPPMRHIPVEQSPTRRPRNPVMDFVHGKWDNQDHYHYQYSATAAAAAGVPSHPPQMMMGHHPHQHQLHHQQSSSIPRRQVHSAHVSPSRHGSMASMVAVTAIPRPSVPTHMIPLHHRYSEQTPSPIVVEGCKRRALIR